MTSFASVATFSREGKVVFFPPRLENTNTMTQARKTASRHWVTQGKRGDKLQRIFVVTSEGRAISISEHEPDKRGWKERRLAPREAVKIPYLAAAMNAAGLDASAFEETPPPVLIINGWKYVRAPRPEDI